MQRRRRRNPHHHLLEFNNSSSRHSLDLDRFYHFITRQMFGIREEDGVKRKTPVHVGGIIV